MASQVLQTAIPPDFEIQEYEPLKLRFKKIPSATREDTSLHLREEGSNNQHRSDWQQSQKRSTSSEGRPQSQQQQQKQKKSPRVSPVSTGEAREEPSPDSADEHNRYKRIERPSLSHKYGIPSPPTPVLSMRDAKIPPDFFNKTMADFARLFYYEKDGPADTGSNDKRIQELYRRIRYCMGSVDANANELLVVKSTLDGVVPTVYQLAHQVSLLSQEMKNPDVLALKDPRFQQQRMTIESFVNQNFQRFSSHINQMTGQISLLNEKDIEKEELYDKLEDTLANLGKDNGQIRSKLDEMKKKHKRECDELWAKLEESQRENKFLKNEYTLILQRLDKLENLPLLQRQSDGSNDFNSTASQGVSDDSKPVSTLHITTEADEQESIKRFESQLEHSGSKRRRKSNDSEGETTPNSKSKQKSPKSMTINKSDILKYQANPKLLDRALRSSRFGASASPYK